MSKLQNICFYPQLTEKLYEKIVKGISIDFSYQAGGELTEVNYTDDNDRISFDKKSNWNCDDYDLKVGICIELKNLSNLFGKDGIAPLNSEIGLCIEWYSAQGKIRQVIKAKEKILSNDDEKSFFFDFTLPKQTFTGVVFVNSLLYLSKSAKNVEDNEKKLNNETGVLIGNIMKKTVFMTGDGSLFPIRIEPMPTYERLWKLVLQLDEPDIKQVSEGMVLVFNSAHKDYQFVDPNSKTYCDRLADEIVTNAIILFLYELKQSLEFDLDGSYEEGTILAYAKYCKDRLNINFDSITTICDSVHKFSEKGE